LAGKEAGHVNGRMPAKVSVTERASVTAGFANDVDAVNQYASARLCARLDPAQAALRGIRKCDGRIEMRAGDRPEGEDERDQRGTRHESVGEERDADAAGTP
jgi:hypothetical protein